MLQQNQGFVAFPSLSRTAPDQPKTRTPLQGIGLELYVNITAVSGASAITVFIEEEMPGNSGFYNVLSSTSLNAVGVTRMVVHPAVTPAANLAASTVLGGQFRIRVTHATTDATTYDISGYMLAR